MKNYIYTFLIFLFFTANISAQAPNSFNYQGVARNSTGQPLVSQAIKLRISILTGTSTGTAEYVETHSATTNSQGLFNLAIGAGSVVSGNISTINWGSANKYLKVEIDPTGGTSYTLTGTQQLLSVPYALYSGNSYWTKTATGIGSSDAISIPGGNWNPAESEGDLKIGDNTYNFKIGVATGGGGAGDVRMRATGGQKRLILGGGTNDVLTVTETSVGIGTITPGATKLLVQDTDNDTSANIAQFMSNDQGQVLGIGYNSIEAMGLFGGDLKLRAKGTGEVKIEKGNLVLANDANLIFRAASFPGGYKRIQISPVGAGIFNTNLLVIDAGLQPQVTNTYDLGYAGDYFSSPIRWRSIFLQNSPDIASDRRLKENIANIPYGLKEILKLRPVSYFLKADPAKATKLGLIAQETKEVIPEIVSVSKDPDHMMGIQYTDLVPVLIKGMQEQQKLIDELEEKQKLIDALQKQNDQLNSTLGLIQSRIERLEEQTGGKVSIK